MNETIAAIATGLTESGIGIIRISGPDSYNIIKKIFVTKAGTEPDLNISHRVHYGFVNVSRETSDEVLMINMKAPRSYTGEDTIEIDCHGGILMMKKVLMAVLEAGARPAEPGEFTKRAFLNGRIDLSQAEAVADVITAKNDNAIRAAASQLKGSVSKEIGHIRAEILEMSAFIEAALDDPEHYSLDGYGGIAGKKLLALKLKINKLIESYRYGKIAKEGINTVIVGKPNAGKSSLLNALIGEERAIVTEIPGTTRDIITETVYAGSISINLIDTAGIRKTDDVIESIGVKRAMENAKNADLILCVVDMSEEIDEQDREIFDFVSRLDVKVITLFNKSDLAPLIEIDKILDLMPDDKKDYLIISAKDEKGIDKLYKHIEDMFSAGQISMNDEVVINSMRHVSLLKEALELLNEAGNSIEAGMSEDFWTIDLMAAYNALGRITGEDTGEDLINEIFSKFCMGK